MQNQALGQIQNALVVQLPLRPPEFEALTGDALHALENGVGLCTIANCSGPEKPNQATLRDAGLTAGLGDFQIRYS